MGGAKRELMGSTKPAEPPPPKPSLPSVKSAADDVRAEREQWPDRARRAGRNAPQVVLQRHGDRHDSDSGDDDPADDVLLRSPAVRQRYRCSDMWIYRRLTDASGFPKPIYIAGIRHWRLSELVAWERAQAELPVPKPRILEHHDRALAALAEKRAEERRKKAEQAETAREP